MQAAGNLVICIQMCQLVALDHSAFLACLYLVDSPMLAIENPPTMTVCCVCMYIQLIIRLPNFEYSKLVCAFGATGPVSSHGGADDV